MLPLHAPRSRLNTSAAARAILCGLVDRFDLESLEKDNGVHLFGGFSALRSHRSERVHFPRSTPLMRNNYQAVVA